MCLEPMYHSALLSMILLDNYATDAGGGIYQDIGMTTADSKECEDLNFTWLVSKVVIHS